MADPVTETSLVVETHHCGGSTSTSHSLSKIGPFHRWHDIDRRYYAPRLKAGHPDLLLSEAASGKNVLELYCAKLIDYVILSLIT